MIVFSFLSIPIFQAHTLTGSMRSSPKSSESIKTATWQSLQATPDSFTVSAQTARDSSSLLLSLLTSLSSRSATLRCLLIKHWHSIISILFMDFASFHCGLPEDPTNADWVTTPGQLHRKQMYRNTCPSNTHRTYNIRKSSSSRSVTGRYSVSVLSFFSASRPSSAELAVAHCRHEHFRSSSFFSKGGPHFM